MHRSGGGDSAVAWGADGDVPVPGDYDGDGAEDVAVFRPSTATWHVAGSSGGTTARVWGVGGDVPAGDYDGDGRADLAVYRPSTATWHVAGADGVITTTALGALGDVAAAGDHDGDGATDEALFSPATGTWRALVSSAASRTYAHDGAGNRSGAGADSFSYDGANRMTASTVGGTSTSYAYDGDGLRLSSALAGGPTTEASWDTNAALPRLAAEHDGTGTELRRYGYGLQRVSMTTPGTSSYYHHDRMGSAVLLNDASGATGWRYRYGAFGETRAPQGEGPHNPMRYTAEHLDDTGLYHLRARQYDPGTARFLSTDPLAPPIDDPYVSAYVYVGNRPTVFTDPSGLCIVCLDTLSTALKGAAFLAGGAALVVATAATAPVSVPLILGGASVALSIGATVIDCRRGFDATCATSVAGTAVGAVSFGVGAAAAAGLAEGVRISSPLFIQTGTNLLGLFNSGISFVPPAEADEGIGVSKR